MDQRLLGGTIFTVSGGEKDIKRAVKKNNITIIIIITTDKPKINL